jgi:hypothetical protein
MCEDYAPNFGHKRSGCCFATTYSLTHFTRDSFTKRNVTDALHPPYFTLLPRLKINLKSRHFNTIEVMEAEPQAVLNTLTALRLIEHNFRDALKNSRSSENGAYTWERLLRGCWWPVGPNIL